MTKLFNVETKIFWGVATVCLLPFILLAFLNSMALDDYFFYELYRAKPFFGVQHDLYLTWAGRYTSAFITGVFIVPDAPGRFTFLPTLIYFVLTWSVIRHLLKRIGTVFPEQLSDSKVPGFVLFILFLYVQADIATGFYWLSAVTVYQTAFILFLLLLASLVSMLNRPRLKVSGYLFLSLLVLLIVGCNEIMAVFLPLFLASLAAGFYFYGRPVPRWLWLILGIAIGMDLIIFFTSGVMTYRYREMNAGTGMIAILGSIVFRGAAVFFYIFKEPLFWVCAAAIFASGLGVPADLNMAKVFREKNVIFWGMLALLLVVLLSLTVFLLASRGSMPPRVLNNLSDVTACLLLALCFLAGIFQGGRSRVARMVQMVPERRVKLAVFVICLLASVNYAEAWKSVASGYFYHAVMMDRDRVLKNAAAEHRRVAVIRSYDAALRDRIDRAFPHGVFTTVHALLVQKPSLLFFYDGAGAGDRAYAHFYGLDSIIVRDK